MAIQSSYTSPIRQWSKSSGLPIYCKYHILFVWCGRKTGTCYDDYFSHSGQTYQRVNACHHSPCCWLFPPYRDGGSQATGGRCPSSATVVQTYVLARCSPPPVASWIMDCPIVTDLHHLHTESIDFPIPLILTLPSVICGCRHFSLDSFRDHVGTCKSH